MRAVAGILVALGMMLSACDGGPNMDPAPQETATLSEEHERTQESAVSNGDCKASIYCGSWTTCSGTEGQCSITPATATSLGGVTCNGVWTACRPILQVCGCGQDGCCSELCFSDPDCGPLACVRGKTCTADSQCGGSSGGRCSTSTRTCVCL
ncbi:hypothetical protein HPC49_36835 [Pyxidicoccus fallax]|uniref:Lipoprotein n=1 Tax=Pyxidicoccus fallax TaxID=394095 RepID=A0A848LS67_9BACT|nr:hypothetical protein [Pyxidicoccus fallax]NMO20373.1 hypothetical protein [Pyxidicoccus fallax]NPC83773.1 hypothetical protein [Pyxidicoccus fallax]